MRVNLWMIFFFFCWGIKNKRQTRKSRQHTFTTESKRQNFLVYRTRNLKQKGNSLVSSCPGLFLGAEGLDAATRALFSLIVAASTVFCLLKLLPPLPTTVPPVTVVAWLWFVVLPGLGAMPKKNKLF